MNVLKRIKYEFIRRFIMPDYPPDVATRKEKRTVLKSWEKRQRRKKRR